MAALSASVTSSFDIGSFEFSHSGCTFCHPGGGPLEYDREGYRYDGKPSGLIAGTFNPNRGTDAGGATAGTGSSKGDYYTFDPASGTIVDKTAVWQTGGVAEIDCYMCHLVSAPAGSGIINADYRNNERNFGNGNPAAVLPGSLATYGLANTGLLTNVTLATSTANPSVTGFLWTMDAQFRDANGFVATKSSNQGPPTKENCAVCHFPDKSKMTAGPAGNPLGYTSWQKLIPANTVNDPDIIAPPTTLNNAEWKVAKGRVEGGKRGESINDPNNPDVHMDRGMQCYECHFLLGRGATKSEILGDGIGNEDGICNSGEACQAVLDAPDAFTNFPALTDSNGNVIQPAIEVWKIDHQFAKGDNTPDGKNMDQLDNTVTCASCHITRTHPEAAGAPDPSVAHAGFPALHFDVLSCKVCHIPVLNGPVDQVLADFTTGPYRTFERVQSTSGGALGINQKPLYMWRATEHGKGHMELQPFGIMAVSLVANATSIVDQECGSIAPTFQRLGKKAAENMRVAYGDANGDGIYDFTLNRPQNGDTALIVNKSTEITDFINQIKAIPGSPADPVIHFYFNQFSISHNIMPKGGKCIDRNGNGNTNDPGECNYILGSAQSGGCVACHSSSNPASPNYSKKSVGLFDKTYTVFNQPTDGGQGLVQTAMLASDGVTMLERVNLKFPYKTRDNTTSSVNLSNAPGQTVRNTVNQSELLDYDSATLAYLASPEPAGISKPVAVNNWSADAVVDYKVNFDGSGSTCQGGCSYAWDFN
ncbi:MAG: hypothetical protein AB1553_16115, partial [Nitrospirota bacterium]